MLDPDLPRQHSLHLRSVNMVLKQRQALIIKIRIAAAGPVEIDERHSTLQQAAKPVGLGEQPS